GGKTRGFSACQHGRGLALAAARGLDCLKTSKLQSRLKAAKNTHGNDVLIPMPLKRHSIF
ncbi:hypothetical protein L0337_27210, partial [candidate division KSB1 bacterium]|nr:hypothetical protein [candidate division KSB1 bacterium]